MQPVVLATISLNAMAGGLEKNIILLANHLSEHGYGVRLVTFDLNNANSFYTINDKVQWHKVGIGKPHAQISLINRIKLIQNIRNIIRGLKSSHNKPIIICFHHGILFRFFAAALFTGSKIICSERNSLSLYKYISKKKWNLNFFLLTFVKKIIVQFPSYQQNYPFWMKRRILSIHNPVLPSEFCAKANMPDENGRFKILTVGRLSAQKQQHVLINAFADISRHYPAWDLVIVGDGALRPNLEKLIKDKGLQDRVFLVGKSTNVYEWMTRSHLFCLPSQWEGFPNALAEALAHGLPAVGFSECAGVNALIQPGKNGLLASGNNDPMALAKVLQQLMASPDNRRDMGQEAIETVALYKPDTVFDQWERLFLEVSGRGEI